MAESHHVAVIDIGKTNAKLVLFDTLHQREVTRLTTANTVVVAEPYPHFDIDSLWRFILAGLTQLASLHGIDAISITTHGASAALLNARGELALPLLDYEHDGPDSLARDYERFRAPFAETGSPRLPAGLNLGAQIYWLSRRFPDQFRSVRAIVPYPQYWASRLCGVLASEVTSLGCHTDLWDYRACDFSSMVGRLGWRELMPPLRRAGDCLGPILPSVAAETKLSPSTPVYCGIHDSNASLYPHLLSHSPPFAVVSTGTWVVTMAVGGPPVTLDPGRDTLVNVNALGVAVPSARFMGGREFELLAVPAQGNARLSDTETVLDKGVMLLPSVVTGCGPFADRAMEWRRAEGRTADEIQAAASFYLALMTQTCLTLTGAEGDIIVEGPFVRNASFLAMLAASTGQRVLVSEGNSTGTALGASLLAGTSPRLSYTPVAMQQDQRQMRAYAAAWRDALMS